MKTNKALAAAIGAALGLSAMQAAMAADGSPTTVINVFPEGAPAAAEAPAAEAPEGDHSFSANVALVSNYVFRGQSQTDKGPAIQGGFDYTYNPLNIYVGTWASNVESTGFDGSSMELDLYGGWRPTFDKLTLDLGVLGYFYPGNDGTGNDGINTVEYKAGISYDFGFVTPGFTFYYSPDWYATDDSAQRYELSASVPLPWDMKLVAKYGWNEFGYDSNNDYQDWSVGITKDVLGVTLGLTYTDTVSLDEKTYCVAPFQCDGQVVASISKSF
jgi:uncharacterized protein (TIGR02001 family)